MELQQAIGKMLGDERERQRFQIFFNNEYYPAVIPVRDRILLLPRAIESLIERGALAEADRAIVELTRRLADDWFVPSD